jgi:hypothetical protein
VLVHLLINLRHGAAHAELHIGLGVAGQLFVAVVIPISPLVAMVLLWTRHQRVGLMLLAVSMAGSLVFGVVNHFVMPGPDQVGQQGSGQWSATFAVTAWLLAITETVGVVLPLVFLVRGRGGSSQ